MGHLRVKTTYGVEGSYGSTEKVELYCHHNMSSDCITYYDSDGEVTSMAFQSWSKGNDLWDAMQRLWHPFKGEWGKELKDGVEYYSIPPWESTSHNVVGQSEQLPCPECGDYGRIDNPDGTVSSCPCHY
jgi:hypothetical protein